MTDEIYFFDSYALIEILNANLNYKKYLNAAVITTNLNLFEVFYKLLREIGELEADIFLREYSSSTANFGIGTIRNAAKLKARFKNKNLSMTDCIGYSLACELGIKFLTGDKEFEGLDSVEFVK